MRLARCFCARVIPFMAVTVVITYRFVSMYSFRRSRGEGGAGRGSDGGKGGATGALAPKLIVKFRGFNPPKKDRVCLVPSRLNFFRLDDWVYTRLQ